MKEKRVIDPEQIHLVKVQTLKGALDSEAIGNGGPTKEYEYEFDASIGVNVPEKIIGIKLLVQVTTDTEEQKRPTPVASYTHELLFIIDNLDDFSDSVENLPEPKVDRLLLGTVLGIAYSTVRGIVYTRTQGPDFKGILLPVIDPKRLLKPEKTVEPTDENEKIK